MGQWLHLWVSPFVEHYHNSNWSLNEQLLSFITLVKLFKTTKSNIYFPPSDQKKPVRRRYEPYGMYSDDDANSDASSACSERSYGSRNGGIPHYLRQTEDVAEVLNHCASSNWSERKEGLIGLQNLLKSQRTLR